MKKHNAGVTLVELMIVVTILAIIASVAVPGYRSYVIRANRSEAKATLLSTAAALERCYTRFNAYNDAGCSTATAAETEDGIMSESGKYRVTGVIERTTFDLTATPQTGQTDDTGCANMLLDETGKQDRSGSKPVAECWGK